MDHTIATYNMSFMSDLDTTIGPEMAFASEAAFLRRLKGDPDRRKYWKNAATLLKKFIDEKEPSAIGLQEMNLTEPGTNKGTDAINQLLNGTTYKQESGKVQTNNAGISILYNTEIIGEKVVSKIIDNANQGGRPILFLLTQLGDKYYLSISMHGMQDPKKRLDMENFNNDMKTKNKEFLEKEANQFLNDNGNPKLTGIFVMGDFNDRYDGITEINIGGKKLTYSGTAPKSCCFNWDSAGGEDDIELVLFEDDANGKRYKTGKVPPAITNAEGKIDIPGDRAKIKNYLYAGDKVFGYEPKTQMQMFNANGIERVSEESDHELVYATVSEIPQAEGGRRRRRSTKKVNKRRSKKSKTRSRKH